MSKPFRRRRFLQLALAGLCGLADQIRPGPLAAFPRYDSSRAKDTIKKFSFAQLVYRKGKWDPDPSAVSQLLHELEATTSVEAFSERVDLKLSSPELFSYPFLYITGVEDFEPFPEPEIKLLRAFLKAGGTLVGDDSAATPGYGFDSAFRREIARVFPDLPLKRLPSEHTIFRSFFLIRGMGGRRIASPFLEGITLQNRTAVVYCPNALGAAWAKDTLGRWVHPCTPGGERQRRLAFQLGVNLVLYALCDDYKQDRIHLPFLRQKI